MLSDEEKKAIEIVKSISEDDLLNYWEGPEEPYNAIQTILNLIEKQSKEIEHQKEKRENQKKELAILNAKQIEFNKLVNTVNSYKGQFKRQEKEIEELKEINEEIGKALDEWINGERTSIFHIHKDKIKAKIEEVKDGTFDAKIVLQSLLEKE